MPPQQSICEPFDLLGWMVNISKIIFVKFNISLVFNPYTLEHGHSPCTIIQYIFLRSDHNTTFSNPRPCIMINY
ncbi:hypothetical protein HanIR_Chr03g0107111 [Helianthus annuus]|nr:hypothetical protein HanIR_Chr03g0107111 [Helianthus annuus]